MDRGTIWHVWLPLIGRHGLAQWLGLLLGLIGLGGVILARYTLGRSFSWVPKASELVTGGIYCGSAILFMFSGCWPWWG
ncbi:MAG TPA: hypothetical protein VJX30_09485 [Terriglobales bacterium]|nr:hypothetical protein [Terriglobales bacterium]